MVLRLSGKSFEQAEREFTAETWLIGDEQIRGAGITGVLVDGEAPKEAPPELAAAKKRVQASREMLMEARRKEAAETEKTAARRRAAIQALNVNPPDFSPKSEHTEEGGANMDLKEFLAQNPQAEADVLAWAKTKLTGETGTAVKAETERIGKLLALGGVQLSDEIKAAIQGGKTVEEYAVAELTKQREIQAKILQQGTPPAPPGHVAQTPAEQAGNPRGEPPADTLTEDDLSRYAARRHRGV